jgi:prepilin-type N-terminal cleavage/methylation domain-containing protein
MRGERGFTLIEMVVVIAIIGFVMAILTGITRGVVSQQRYQTTRARIANIDNALTIFVSQNKRLPCPADGRLASTDANAGLELSSGTPRTCTNNQQHGVIPWRALGLTAADAEDGWSTRFTYRAGPDLVVDSAMDFSSCDPAGSGVINTTIAPISATSVPPWCIVAGTGAFQCNSGNLGFCTPPNTALTANLSKGLVVENVAGGLLMDPRGTGGGTPSSGAAYAVISHGPEGGGGYAGDGVLQSSTVAAGTKEGKNFANLAWSNPTALPASPTVFIVDDVINGTSTTAHFDDIVSRPGILALAGKAGLAPRSH